jgi:hypothetical protein
MTHTILTIKMLRTRPILERSHINLRITRKTSKCQIWE